MSRGPSASHEHEVHANVILSVLLLAGLAYAVLSSAVIPALPTIQRDLHTTETGVTWVLTGFLLGVGRHRDHRAARRHVRQGAAAAVHATGARGGTLLAALSTR